MKKNISNSVAVVIIAVLLTSCGTKKAVVVAPKPKVDSIVPPDTKSETLNLLKSKQLQFNTLSLKGKANLTINGEANDVTMNFRIKDKQVIWVSITAVGGVVEVARALITPDSIKIMDRLKGRYIKKPFSYIYNFTNKQVNFNTLQNILTGNAISGFLNLDANVKLANGVWTLSGSKEDLDYKFLFNTLYKVEETNLSDSKSGQALKVTYNNYQKLDDYLVPGTLKINTLSGAKKIIIAIDYVKVEGNSALNFPFNVPSRFELVK
ncbi:hypothetical protein ABIB40_002377 [Pedobacter sp. UYP30]|uniref:DUF4292 domain-containing protein n=1 Tax=Pedobacter sp. UYP30 TaxID=1756400 RepID=UPI003392ECC0